MTPRTEALRRRLREEKPVFAPLCLEPMIARLCDDLGFGAGYLSGGGLGYSRAISEALLTTTELSAVASWITRRTELPLIVDIGVGFGDPVHVTRAIWEMEASGAAGVELEDQVAPKRVSHHRGVEHLIPVTEMAAKIEAAANARQDPNLLIIARTGGVRNEGFDAAIARGRAYVQAGADMVMLFPRTEEQWLAAPERLDCPVAVIEALHTRTRDEWSRLGYDLVIDPYTGQVLAYEAIRDAYARQARGQGGRAREDLMDLYGELFHAAGLEALYDIEKDTTEKPLPNDESKVNVD